MTTDAELLREYSEDGSERAFAEIVERYLAVVYSAALRQTGGDVHRAKEVAQSVFTLLGRKARSLCRHPALIGWLYTTTHYTAKKLRRGDQARARLVHRLQTMNSLPEGGDPQPDWETLRPLIDAVMVEVPERDRTA